MLRARGRGPGAEAQMRRKVQRALLVEHVAFALAIATALALLWLRHWGLGQARWLAIKIGLTAFLLVPLEAMHAWIVHGWIGPGLRGHGDAAARELERGIGMEDMLRALAVPLLALALPLLVWLSVRQPT